MSRCLLGILMDGETLRLAIVSRGLRETRLVDCLQIEKFQEKSPPELGRGVRAFVEKNKAASCRSVLVIPRSEFIVRKLDLPVEAQANLAKVVEYQVASFLPSEETTICYDFLVAKVGKDTRSIGVTVFVLLKSVVEAKLQICESAGLKIEKVVPSSAVLASCFECLTQKEQKPAMAFCYATGHSSEFASFTGGNCSRCRISRALLKKICGRIWRERREFSEARPRCRMRYLWMFSSSQRFTESGNGKIQIGWSRSTRFRT